MVVRHKKGSSRVEKDAIRAKEGEPRANLARNASPHCRYAEGARARRNKGRLRFKTGRRQK